MTSHDKILIAFQEAINAVYKRFDKKYGVNTQELIKCKISLSEPQPQDDEEPKTPLRDEESDDELESEEQIKVDKVAARKAGRQPGVKEKTHNIVINGVERSYVYQRSADRNLFISKQRGNFQADLAVRGIEYKPAMYNALIGLYWKTNSKNCSKELAESDDRVHLLDFYNGLSASAQRDVFKNNNYFNTILTK